MEKERKREREIMVEMSLEQRFEFLFARVEWMDEREEWLISFGGREGERLRISFFLEKNLPRGRLGAQSLWNVIEDY